MNITQFSQWFDKMHADGLPPQPLIMGILNLTPDSFFDGGVYCKPELALARARQMIAEGVDIIDIGGESTRPGAMPVTAAEELARLLPIIRLLRAESDIVLSVDTTKAQVMEAAIIAGASMINDITALGDDSSLQCAADLDVPICLMHMQGTPETMQYSPYYQGEIVEEINRFFQQRLEVCLTAGIQKKNLILDPGFGFGKLPQHNLCIVNQLAEFRQHDLPLLLGVSRKSTLGHIVNQPIGERMVAGLTMAIFAVAQGLAIIRTHDVKETKQAFLTLAALENTKG